MVKYDSSTSRAPGIHMFWWMALHRLHSWWCSYNFCFLIVLRQSGSGVMLANTLKEKVELSTLTCESEVQLFVSLIDCLDQSISYRYEKNTYIEHIILLS